MNANQVLATVAVSDFAASSAWYTRLFGRGPDHCPSASCVEWDIARCTRIQVLRRDAAQEVTRSGNGPSVGILVEDLDGILIELQGRHIEVAKPQAATHFLRFVPVSDPDGNLVTFVESLAS
jgi:catechol 2,3-dioxygenase-like lactoylglutathione lyase family enzyme